MRSRLLAPISFVFAMMVAASGALAADWTVQRSSGNVSFLRGGVTPVSLSSADVVKPGDRVATGKSGRVMLVRGAEYILIAPGSELIVPADQGTSGRTILLQASGEISFEVEKRNVQHFEVRTRWLAAIVKGTRFTVRVDKFESSVFVDRGIVEVFDFDTFQVAMVHAGQSARTFATRGAGLSLSGQGTLGTIEQREPGASGFEATAGEYHDALNGPGAGGGATGLGGLGGLLGGMTSQLSGLSAGASVAGGTTGIGGLGAGASAAAGATGTGGLGAGASAAAGATGTGGFGASASASSSASGSGGLGAGASVGGGGVDLGGLGGLGDQLGL